MAWRREHGGSSAFIGKLREYTREATAVGAALPLVLSGPTASPLKYEPHEAHSPTKAARIVEHSAIGPIKITGDSTLIFASHSRPPEQTQAKTKNANFCDPAHLPSVRPDTSVSSIFNSTETPGIVAADGAHEVIVHGEKFMFFSDSLVGKVSSDDGHINQLTGFIHNAALVNVNGKWESVFGGTPDKPTSLLPDLSKHRFKWLDTPIAENGKILVFDSTFDDSNPFGHFEGKSAIEMFSTDANGIPVHEETINLPPDATTRWGSAVVSDPKGDYRYIYGNSNDPQSGEFFGMKVARVQTGHTTDINSWQYWDGTDWVAEASQASLIHTDAVFTGITYSNGKFIAVSIPQNVFTDNHIEISCADSPVGPWTTPEDIYTIPEIAKYHNQVAYMPTFFPSDQEGKQRNHPQLIIIYNTNTTDGLNAIKQNPARYRPDGVTISPAA